MDRPTHTAAIKKGDLVAYSRQFLQNTGQFTGDAPFARGTVTHLLNISEGLILAEIAWNGQVDLPNKVNVHNLSPVRNGTVIEPS